MEKVVFSCSCFIDLSVWFVDSKRDNVSKFADGITSDVFIFERRYYCNRCENVVCCLNCFEFLLTCMSMLDEFIDELNKLNCYYLIEEPFCYNSLIYIGNHLLIFNGEHNDCRSTQEILEKYFKKYPNEKSCFTSLDKFSYSSFCFSCKKIFKDFFLKKLCHFC